MIANFVGDVLFAEDNSLERFVNELTEEKKKTFGDFVRDFINWINGIFGKTDEVRMLEKKYAELFGSEKRFSESETQYAFAPKRLSENDLSGYLRAGGRANKSKLVHLNEGKKIILTTEQQIADFISKSIEGDKNLVISAYGMVGDRLATDVRQYSKGKIDIHGSYLELVPEDIRHSYREHHIAKEQGDIALTLDDYLNIPEYLDNYDDLVYAIQFSSGATRICVSKKTDSGRIILIETVSKSRGAVEFKNMIGVSENKYIHEYQSKYKNRNSASTGGSNSSNISPHNNTASNDSIPQNSNLSTPSDKNILKTEDNPYSYTPPKAERIAALDDQFEGGLITREQFEE